MLYCPNCKQTYEEGTRRFCANDGLRLLPAPSAAAGKSANQTSGVFTSAFNRAAVREDPKNAVSSPLDVFEETEPENPFPNSFQPPTNSRIFKPEPEVQPEMKTPPVKTFKSEPEFELELEDIADIRTHVQTAPQVIEETIEKSPVAVEQTIPAPAMEKPAPRVIKEREVPASQAALGDRKINPTGRAAVTWGNPEVLIGQTVKGRYRITEKIGENESGFAFLAEDKIVEGKRVLVRILMDEEASAFFTDNVFAEERVSLSHVVHPNVASVIDSGELPEGKPFIITEYVEGKSVKDMLAASGQFNVARAARIIRQASYALSEMHQNRIFHRGLTPEDIILTVSENGIEQVKIIGFGVSRENSAREDFAYKAPEQIEGKPASAASDLYSLAVVAYQMLTNRLPFGAASASASLKIRRSPLALRPTDLRLDATEEIDAVLEKALAFDPAARYPKARDFGDAFFNCAAANELRRKDAEETETVSRQANSKAEMTPAIAALHGAATTEAENLNASSTVSANEAGKKSAEDLPWERRSPEPPKTAKMNWAITALLGAIVIAAFGVWYFAARRQNQSPTGTVQTAPQTAALDQSAQTPTLQKTEPTPEEIESAPLPRSVAPPAADSVYFENSKQNLTGDAAKNFLGFSLYYPKDWRRNDAKNNFLDVSKNAPTGTPIEQMLVSFYDSRGTFRADREAFPKLKERSEAQLKSFVPNYRTVSDGETTVNGGWRAYEIKFEGAGKTGGGETIKLFGRRLYIPAARVGMKNGYVLTLLATSLSTDVRSAEEVGVKGDLETVLRTFEPNQNF